MRTTLKIVLPLIISVAAISLLFAAYQVRTERLTRHLDGGVYLEVLADGEPAVELHNPSTGDVVLLIPQRAYGKGGRHLRSISFRQIPDITVEVQSPSRPPHLYLFDPKYKLQSEEAAECGDGRPKKIDIDTMHAYRDAIRDSTEQRVVNYAAILYPGPELRYGDGIEALSARPLKPESLHKRLRTILTKAITWTAEPLQPQ